MIKRSMFAAVVASLLASSAIAQAQAPEQYDLLIDNGTIYDGMGGAPFTGDVAIRGDRIVYVGPQAPGSAKKTVDASGMAVSPGFINMLSWAVESLIADGRGLSDTTQGVTLEVFGEGNSMGPLNPEMKKLAVQRQDDIKYPIKWTTLGEYLTFLTKKGITPNVASFIGRDDRPRSRAWREGRRSDTGTARSNARARARRDEGRRARRRLLHDLRSRELRGDPRAHRDHDRGRKVRRHVHQPHALRRRSPRRSGR